VAQRTIGHRPPAAKRADKVLGGHSHVGEEDLVEIEVPTVVDHRERPTRDPRRIGGNQQRADAAVLFVGVGADEREYDVRVVGARRPELLAVDHEMAVLKHRVGAQPGQIRTRAGLTHSQRRRAFRAQDWDRPALLLLDGPEGQQRRRDDPNALWVEAVIDPPSRQFLAVHVLLQHASVAAAKFGWIAWQQPSVVELQPLPLPGPFGHMGSGSRALLRGIRLNWEMFVQERDELRPEVLDVRVEGELHGPPRITVSADQRPT
jgi:hypothetical protein